VFIPGNEGLAQVEDVGSSVKSLSKGDWVIFAKKQAGTWSSGMSVSENEVIKVDRAEGLADVHAATLSVNPSTAYNMLKDFVQLKPGDWVLQNGANSAVGQAVVQIAASRGLKTINFIRNRANVDELKKYLTDLGATQVLTYDDLEDKSLDERVNEWTGGKEIRLLLNCIGDKSTTRMLRLLGQGAQVVTYGGMAKAQLSIPPGVLIFKDLVFRGFWQSQWYAQKGREERVEMTKALIKLISEGKLKEPTHEIVTINGRDDDATATKKVQELMAKVSDGTYGRKVLMKIEPVDA
jgi:NADPH:quinone reductase-like Zn-dependent oxidoreductase